MEESKLQREFKGRDVQRMRNIITKDYNAKTTTQVGYSKAYVDRKEGDVWEEDGKKWILKNGIKQTVTRFDKLKESILLPLTCPNCSKAMKNDTLNKKMWPIHKMCFDCVVNIESELKRTGKFEEYQRNMVMKGVKTYIKEMEGLLLDIMLESGKETFVTEAGDVEEWRGGVTDKTKIVKDLQEYIKQLKDISEA